MVTQIGQHHHVLQVHPHEVDRAAEEDGTGQARQEHDRPGRGRRRWPGLHDPEPVTAGLAAACTDISITPLG
jgi:hypothetical protein